MGVIYVALSLAAIAAVLVANEIWWRRRTSHSEHHRKLVHMVVGTFVAFWPYYMTWTDIRLISLAFLLVVVLSKALNIFAAIHEVERFSVGEICFALAVGILTFIVHRDWVYAASLMQMSLADGMAAIIGVHYGKKNSYKVLGARKSLAGSAAFFITSFLILVIIGFVAGSSFSIGGLLLIAALSAIVENVAVYGMDNLLLPVVTALILTHL